MALLGPALAAAWLLTRWKGRWALLTTVIVLTALAADSCIQTSYWYDDLTLFTHAIEVNPDSVLGHFNLGLVYGWGGDTMDAQIQKAAAARAFLLNPDAYNSLAHVSMVAGREAIAAGKKDVARRDFDTAIQQYAARLQSDPTNAVALAGLREAKTALEDLQKH